MTHLRYLLIVGVVASLLTVLGCSATGDRSETTRSEHGVLLDRERAWTDAMRTHDCAALERILGRSFA